VRGIRARRMSQATELRYRGVPGARRRSAAPIIVKRPVRSGTRLLQSPGVRHVRLHDGRHAGATLLLSENVHPRVVMELLGALLLPGVVGPTATRDDSGRPPCGRTAWSSGWS